MAFEFLDLDNKLYTPTKMLSSQFQSELSHLYLAVRQYLIDAHRSLALSGKEWYENPVETTKQWGDVSVAYGSEVYAKVTNELIPQAEAEYADFLLAANDLGARTKQSINYVVENPNQVTTETIESITQSLTEAGNLSTELATELQLQTSEIVALLLEQPMQTLESAYMEILSSLLNGYFELVSNILISL